MDPLADAPLNVGTSPYAYVWNNPIKFIDPDGRQGTSHHLDSDGRVIGSIDDGDENTYVHENGTSLDDIIKHNGGTGETSGGGVALQDGGLAIIPWSPNARYRGDRYDPLHDHSDEVVSLEQFEAMYEGMSLADIRYENVELLREDSSDDPDGRYVKDPKTGYVIDMLHFVSTARYGELAGEIQEYRQSYNGVQNSAYHPQDYFSNSLGVEFARAHTTTFLSSSGFTSRVVIYPGGAAASIRKWLNER